MDKQQNSKREFQTIILGFVISIALFLINYVSIAYPVNPASTITKSISELFVNSTPPKIPLTTHHDEKKITDEITNAQVQLQDIKTINELQGLGIIEKNIPSKRILEMLQTLDLKISSTAVHLSEKPFFFIDSKLRNFINHNMSLMVKPKMRLEEKSVVKLELHVNGDTLKSIKDDLNDLGQLPNSFKIRLIDSLNIQAYSKDSTLNISKNSEPQQTLFNDSKNTWEWLLTARECGTNTLTITIDANFIIEDKDYTRQVYSIERDIEISYPFLAYLGQKWFDLILNWLTFAGILYFLNFMFEFIAKKRD